MKMTLCSLKTLLIPQVATQFMVQPVQGNRTTDRTGRLREQPWCSAPGTAVKQSQ